MNPINPVSPTRVVGGRYVVLGELGRGGMGVVWRAEDRVMGRPVAVKELHLPAGLDQQDRLLFRERLLREARTAGRLNDPGIVTVYDVVTDHGVDHIVMELIEARTLEDVVQHDGPLDERTVASIGQQLLAALRVAHEGGVVHRDVKPSNVMLAAGGRIKLTDFGIAHAADDTRLTSTGSIIGSPGYMSPERLEGGAATPAADLWAVGATLWFAVQGRGPFQRETTAATISAVLHADLEPVRTRGSLGSVITGLLQRSPQARLGGPQAAALLASTATAPDTSPTGASPTGTRTVTGPGVTARLTAPVRARPWRWVGVALAVGLVVGLVAGLLGGFTFARSGQAAVTTLTYGPGGDLPVLEAFYGSECLLTRPDPGQQVTSGAGVSCDEPHLAEVFGVLTPFDAYAELDPPGAGPLADYAVSACSLLFGSEIVVGEDKAALEVVAVVPSEQAFTTDTSSGGTPTFERSVYCLLRAADGRQLIGTRVAEPA